MTTQQHYVYIVECSDHTYYTGWTTDLNKRIAVHNNGQGAKYTRSRCPVKLVYYETYTCKSTALKREAAIKKLQRHQKTALIQGGKLLENASI